jgi:PAS domain S-box
MNFIPESKLKKLLSDELDFLFIVNMDGNILELNLAVTSILGYSANELKEKSFLSVYSPEDKEKVSVMIPLVMKGDISSCPYPFTTKAGETIPVDTQFYIGWWNEENVIASVSTNLSAESFSKGLFYSIFNGSKVMMAISTFDHDILFNVNRSFMEATEYSLEELSGKSVQELGLFNDDAEREKILKQFIKERRAEGEITLKAKSGKLIVCLFSIEEIKIRENTYMLSAATDITQRKLMENKLEYLNRQQKLLTDVAELLNKPGDFDDIINTALKLVGEHSNVSRVYIFENTADEQFTNNTHEWCNEGIAGKKKYLQMLPFNKVPSFKKLLNEKGRIFSRKYSGSSR